MEQLSKKNKKTAKVYKNAFTRNFHDRTDNPVFNIQEAVQQLKENKESEGGEIFSELCDDIYQDRFHEIKCNNVDFALGMQEDMKKEYEDNVHDPIFEKE